jgi:hypothetical protein
VAWSALGLEAFARGLVLHNCGCFGVHLGQPLRWWVLAEDAEFVALAAWVRASLSRQAGPREEDQTPGAQGQPTTPLSRHETERAAS